MSTVRQYRQLQKAYDYFNERLFSGSLPQVLITMQRQSHTRGYFAANRFESRSDDTTIHELALNPLAFGGESDEKFLSTLVHVWQQNYGHPGRRGYHNKQWAEKMKEVGLQPSITGKPGGREVGERVTHYVVVGGCYQRAYSRLLHSGFKLDWQARGSVHGKWDRIKFTCPGCNMKAWAKPGVVLICGVCHIGMPSNN